MRRAIVFDLDETLYRERQFVVSGFRAAAHAVEQQFAVPGDEAFRLLRRALADGRRQTAFQDLSARFELPRHAVNELIAVFRAHEPRLRLPRVSRRVLDALRETWTIGILTNGLPDVQARKVAALGLSGKVDAVVYAAETGPGKPDVASFATVLDRLGTPSSAAVFVGDDPWCDIAGARQAGMKTIRISRASTDPAKIALGPDADAVVPSLAAVPAAAHALFPAMRCHGA